MTTITGTGINHFLFNKVKLQQTSTSYLNITEIQVWINGTNIATTATASASSVFNNNDTTQYGPGNLIDGVLDSEPSTNTYDMAQTTGANSWLLLTLSDSYNIKDLESIVIYNRMDDGASASSQFIYDRIIGTQMQVYYNDDLLYNHLISIGRPFYRFDGPAIGNVSSFSNSESSGSIINIQDRGDSSTQSTERVTSYITNITSNTFNSLYVNSYLDQQYLNINEVQIWINGNNVALSSNGSTSSNANANDNDISGNGYAAAGNATSQWNVVLDKYYTINQIESIVIYSGHVRGTQFKGLHAMEDKQIELRNNGNIVYRTNIEHVDHVYRIDGPAIGNVTQYENNFVDGSNNIVSHLGWSTMDEPISSPNKYYAPHVSNMCVNTFNKVEVRRIIEGFKRNSSSGHYIISSGGNKDARISIHELQIWVNIDGTATNVALNGITSAFDAYGSTPAARGPNINDNILTSIYTSASTSTTDQNNTQNQKQFVAIDLAQEYNINDLISIVIYYADDNANYAYTRRGNVGTGLSIYNNNTLLSTKVINRYKSNGTSYVNSPLYDKAQLRFDGPQIEMWTGGYTTDRFYTASGIDSGRDLSFNSKIPSTNTSDTYSDHTSNSVLGIARLYFANYYNPETTLNDKIYSFNMENIHLITNSINSTNSNVFDISSSGALQIPVGTDENIPKGTDAAIGQIRYNSTHDDYQGYNGGNWSVLSGGERNMDNTTRVENITGTFNKLVWKRDYVDKYLSSRYGGYTTDLTKMHALEIQIWVNVNGTLTNVAKTVGTASNSSVDNNGTAVTVWNSDGYKVTNINDDSFVTAAAATTITENEFYTGAKRPSLTISLSNTYNISDLVCVVFWSRWNAATPHAVYNGRNIGTSLRLFQDSVEVAGYSIQNASKYYRIDGPAIGNVANSNFTSNGNGGAANVISTSYDSGDGELPHVASFDRVNMYTGDTLNLTVADEGRVGVNTSLPLHNLHVNGDLRVTGGVKFLLDYNFYQSGLNNDDTQPNFMNKLLRTYDASYGVASFMSNNENGISFNESHGHINTTYSIDEKHQFALNKAQYYPPTIAKATMDYLVVPVVDNSNGYWKFNVNNDEYLWKAYNRDGPSNILFDSISNLKKGPGFSVDGVYSLHEDVSCNVDASGGGWFILKLPEPIYAYGAAIGWPSWDLSGENCQKIQFYASQNGQFFERIGDYDAFVSGHMTNTGDITESYSNYNGPITRMPEYHTDNFLSNITYPKGIAEFNTINKSKRYQYFAVILTERADTSIPAITSRSIGEFHIMSNNSLWLDDSTRGMELPRKFTINNTGTVIETSSTDHRPGAALAVDNNLVIAKDIDVSHLSNDYNLYQKTFNEVRLTRKKPDTNGATPEWIIQVNELQIWVNGRNIAPDGKVYAKNLPSSGINNLTNENLATGITATTSPTTKISDSENYISVILPDSHNIEDIETLLLYNGSTPAHAIGYIIELRNFGNVIYKGEITENKSYYRFDGPSIGNVRTFSSATASTTHIVDDTNYTETFTISFPYDLSYSNAIAENNSVYVDGVIGIADLDTNTYVPANIFSIDTNHNFTIDVSGNLTSKGGLVDNTNWDVSANTLLGDPAIGIQSNVIEAKTLNVLSYVTTPPTIDFDFRLNTTENTVYDKVSGLKADISGSYVISKTGLDLSNSTLNNCAFIELEPFPIGGSFSVETYFLFNDSNSSDGNQRIFEFSDGNYGNKAIILFRNVNSLRVAIRNGTGTRNTDTTFDVTSRGLSINTLYHVVVTVSNTHAYLYIDGNVNHDQEVTDGAMDRNRTNGTTTPVMHKTRSHYLINKPSHQNTPRSSYLMKYFRVYQHTTLSTDEVSKLYHARDSFYDSNASIIDSHISLGSSVDHQNDNIGANRLHFPRSGGIGVSGEILQYIGEHSKGIQFYHNTAALSTGTISMDLSVNIDNGFGTIGVGKFVDNTNYTLDVSGSIVNMYNTTDVSSIFHKTATTDCSGGIVLNSVNSGLQMLNNDGINGLYIGNDGSYNSIKLNGGSLKPATTLNANGNLSGNTDISFVQVDKCKEFVVNGSIITNDYEYNNNDTNVNFNTNIVVNTTNDKGMQVVQTPSSIRDVSSHDANNRTFRKLRLYRESATNNDRHITLYEIQLWINGTNVAANGTVSGTPAYPDSAYTTINDGIFSTIFHAHKTVTHPYIDITLNANYNINDIQAALIYFDINGHTLHKYRTQGIVLQLYDENDVLLHTSPVTQAGLPHTVINVSALYRYQGPAWNTLISSNFTTSVTDSDLSAKIYNGPTYDAADVANRPLLQDVQTASTIRDVNNREFRKLRLYRKSTTDDVQNNGYIGLYEMQLWINRTNVAASGTVSGTPLVSTASSYSNINNGVFTSTFFADNSVTHPYVDISLNANYNINDIQAVLIHFDVDTTTNDVTWRFRTQGIVLQLYDEHDALLYTSPVTQPTSPTTTDNVSSLYRYQGPAWNTLTSSNFTTSVTDSDLSAKIYNGTTYVKSSTTTPVANRPLIVQQFRKIRVQKQRPATFFNWSGGTDDDITIAESLYMPNKTGNLHTITDTDYLYIVEIQVWVNGTNIALSTNGGVASGTTAVAAEYSNEYHQNNVNDNVDYYAINGGYISQLGENNPFIDIDLGANYNVSDIQSMVVYYPANAIQENICCIGTHVELYDEFDNKVYQSNSVKNPCHALRIDGPSFKYFTGSYFSTRGTTNITSFPSGIVSSGSHVNFYDSNTDIVVKVNHEKMDNMLEIINTNGDTYNAGHFVAEPSISVVDSNGNVGINTSAPRAGAKLDIYNAHNPSPGYGLFPVGFTMMFCAGKVKVPSGWLLCDGSTYSTSDYPALGAILGHQGTGTGTDNGGIYGITPTGQFKVPDLKENFPILANTATSYTGLSGVTVDNSGQLGNNTCNVSQLASHEHNINSTTFTEGHTINVNHVLKSFGNYDNDNTSNNHKSNFPKSYGHLFNSLESNNNHMGYVPLHTNVHAQPADFDWPTNSKKTAKDVYTSILRFKHHETGPMKEMFPRISIDAAETNAKPKITLANLGNADPRKPPYTVVNFIMYSGVHETTTYGTDGWS